MLNVELLDELYKNEPKERQQELLRLLFKKSRQTMNYFKRTQDIGMAKLEILSDFFEMPMDCFRLGKENAHQRTVVKNSRYIQMYNVFHGGALLNEYEGLQKDLAHADEKLEDAKKTIATLLAQVESLQEEKKDDRKMLLGILQDKDNTIQELRARLAKYE